VEEPQPLSAVLAALAQRDGPIGDIARAVVASGAEVTDRRARVLKHSDLARRLQTEAGFKRPRQWTGYIPPRLSPIDCDCWPACTSHGNHGGELLRSAWIARNGELVFRYNQVGTYSAGTRVNDSPMRAALIDIAAEAYRREHETSTA